MLAAERPYKRSCFTLLELLVSVVVIVFLLGIILPTFSYTSELAKQGICSSNLKQIYHAITYYSQDNNGYLPAVSNMWLELANRYLSIGINLGDPDEWYRIRKDRLSSPLYCPSDPDPYPWPWMGFSRLEITSYMANGADNAYMSMAISIPLRIGLFGGKGRFTSAVSSSDCMLLAETCNYDRVLDCDHPAINITDTNIRQRIHYRYTSGFYHLGKMNVIFVDGHTDSIVGRKAAPVTPPPPFFQFGSVFFSDLSLPSATEDPLFWGPPYDQYEAGT